MNLLAKVFALKNSLERPLPTATRTAIDELRIAEEKVSEQTDREALELARSLMTRLRIESIRLT